MSKVRTLDQQVQPLVVLKRKLDGTLSQFLSHKRICELRCSHNPKKGSKGRGEPLSFFVGSRELLPLLHYGRASVHRKQCLTLKVLTTVVLRSNVWLPCSHDLPNIRQQRVPRNTFLRSSGVRMECTTASNGARPTMKRFSERIFRRESPR